MKKYFAGIAGMLLALCSCIGGAQSDDSPIPPELATLKFDATVDTWGTERRLEPGDKIGLFAGDPFNAANVMLTVEKDGTLTSSKAIQYESGSQIPSSVTFTAYTPYSSDYYTGYGTFSVQKDQSTQAGVKASDLMVATAKLTTVTNTVTLGFSHKMVRLMFYIDNQSDAGIKDVTVSDVCADASLNFVKGTVEAADFKNATIVAGISETSDSSVFKAAVLIAPQTAKPTVNVTMADGQIKTFVLDKEMGFTTGRQWDNEMYPLVIDAEESVEEAIFTLKVNDWQDGGSFEFTRK